MFIDAIGKACPTPVILTKKAIDSGAEDLTVAVDNEAAVGNLTRLGNTLGLTVNAERKDGNFAVHFSGKAAVDPIAPAAQAEPACTAAGCGYAVFIGKDSVGGGEGELGYNLLKMALYTLAQGEAVPASILFMNSGVKLPAGEEQQVIDSLNELIAKGSEVLVCGTCLNFYGLTEQLKAGVVSNMYDILSRMQAAAKVISL